MKITIESTHSGNTRKGNQAISLSIGYDDVPMEEMRDLIRQALLGYGFHPETVEEYFGEE